MLYGEVAVDLEMSILVRTIEHTLYQIKHLHR